jgi:hypothetical protein
MSTTETLAKFYQNNPNLDLTHLNLNNNETVQNLNWSDDEDRVAAVEELKKAQRLLSLYPSGSQAQTQVPTPVNVAPVLTATTAMSAEQPVNPVASQATQILQQLSQFHSAHHIAGFSENHFVQTFTQQFSYNSQLSEEETQQSQLQNEERARQIHRNAVSKVTRITHLLANTRSLLAPHTQALRVNNLSENIAQYFQGIPGYQDLFGSLDYCECEHCKSIFGAAAYFVDLMRIIDKYITQPNLTSIPQGMKLSDRRPDLAQIKLTCENTNHTIPYLQIVNERLENTVKNALQNPKDIYQTLAQKYYPFELPFHLPLQRIRTYLKQLKTTLAEVYQTLPTDESYIAAETLELSPEEWQLLINVNTDETKLKEYYGVSDLNSLSDVETFCKQVGLKFTELRTLLAQNLSEKEITDGLTKQFFINQGLTQPLQIVSGNETQNIQNINNIALDHIHRFLRLTNKLGWSFADLDWTLHCVDNGTPDINADTLKTIASIKILKDKLNIPISTINILLFDFKTYGQGEDASKSEVPFDLVFNPSGMTPYHPGDENSASYRLNPTYTDGFKLWQPDTADEQNHTIAAWLAAGIGLRQDEIIVLTKGIFYASSEVKLTVENLSVLYRHAQLASLIYKQQQERPPIAQYLKLLELIGKKQATLTIQDIQVITEVAEKLQLANLNIFEVDYIINGTQTTDQPSPYVNPLYRQQDVETWLKTLPSLVTSNAQNSDEQTKEKTKQQLATFFSVRITEVKALLPVLALSLTKNKDDFNAIIISTFLDTSSKEKEEKAKSLIRQLSCWLVLMQKLRLTPNEITSIIKYPTGYGIQNLTQLTMGNIIDIFQFKQLVIALADASDGLVTYLGYLKDNQADQAINSLSTLTGWDKAQIQILLNLFIDDNQIKRLYQIRQVFELVKKTGIDVTFLQNLRDLAGKLANTPWNDYQEAADNLLAILRSRYTPENWDKLHEQLEGKIQEQKRTAFISTVLLEFAKPDHPATNWVKNTRNLYEYLLIDVETSGVAQISYLKEALNAVQLYLNRCRQRLEPGIERFDIPEVWWEWLMNYRVWEANRKVFLYPENYIDPAYRQSKTTLFKELENKLKQSDITKETVENAYRAYLDGFAQLAKLKYVDAFCCNITDETRDNAPTLFLFARTDTKPYNYYYLIQEGDGSWSEWYKVDITIDAEQIAPIYVFNKLFIFWVELKTYDDKTSNEKTTVHKASIKYTYTNFSGGWIQPQTVVQDLVVSVKDSPYRNDHKDLFPDSFFEMDQVWWQKVYPLKIEKERYWTPVAGGNKFEKIVLLYGPMIDTKEIQQKIDLVTLTTTTDVSLKQTDVSLKQFEESLYQTAKNFKLTKDYGYSGNLSVFPSIVIDDGMEVSFLVNPDEFLFLQQESPKSNLLFRPEIDRVAGRLNLIETNHIIVDNYIDEEIGTPSPVRPPQALNQKSFINVPVDIDSSKSQGVYNDLTTFGYLKHGKLSLDINFTDLSKDVKEMFSTSEQAKADYVLKILCQAYGTPSLSSGMRHQNYNLFTVKNDPNNFVFNGDKESFLLVDTKRKADSISSGLFNSDTIFNSDSFVSAGARIDNQGSNNIYQALIESKILDEDGRLNPLNDLTRIYKAVSDLDTCKDEQGRIDNDKVEVVIDILAHQRLFTKESFLSSELKIDNDESGGIFDDLTSFGYLDRAGRISTDVNFSDLFNDLAEMFPEQDRNKKAGFVLQILSMSIFPSSISFFESKEEKSTLCEDKFNAIRLTTAAIHRLSSALFSGGIDKLLSLSSQQIPIEPELPFSRFQFADYRVTAPEAFDGAEVDFYGAYGIYYWELFFHAPFYIAKQLNSNQRFSEAQQWFQYIFNPTLPDNPIKPDSFQTKTLGQRDSQRIYQILLDQKIIENGFVSSTFNRKTKLNRLLDSLKLNDTQIESVRNILLNHQLSRQVAHFWQFQPFRNHTLESLRNQLVNPDEIRAYNQHPFDPHAIARLRIGAYEKAILMQYIDNLLTWGDSFFAQYTWESITTATMLYIYAYNLLGNRPQNLGKCSTSEPTDFATISDRYKYPDGIPQFLINLENEVFSNAVPVFVGSPINAIDAYFSIPENENFASYWDRVEDRLFKIRHNLNIQGIEQLLALFEPSIDPNQLVRAVVAGSDVLSRLTATGQPSHYRFSFLIERAKNFAATVSQLGSALLSALEKKDTESLMRLRATQEKNILNLTTFMKEKQIEEMQQMIASLQESRKNAQYRHDHYQKLYDENLNSLEIADLALRDASSIAQTVAAGIQGLTIAAYLAPNIFGLADGGMQFGEAVNAGAQIADRTAGVLNEKAGMIATIAQYQRRREDWQLQKDTAQYEIEQIQKSILADQVRMAILTKELEIHQQTIQQADEYEDFLKTKFSNQDLYQWMVGRLSMLYFQTYQMALDLAMVTQEAYQHELDRLDQFLSFDYWDSRNQGLLAGESLLLGLQQMEKAYIDNSERYLEIEKTISLLHLDPQKFLEFKYGINGKKQGQLTFKLSEALFDFDFPGHYCRKIKSISLSIPAVVCPYQNLNATLVQNHNMVILKPESDAVKHALDPVTNPTPPDGSIRTDWLANQQIALSRGIDDAGLFVLDFRDEKYLPFEGTGAVSEWTLSLPPETNRIDFSNISDIIVKVQYTAKDGGSKFADDVKGLLSSASPPYPYTLAKLFDLKQAFGPQWYKFINTPPQGGIQQISFPVTDAVLLPNLKDITLTGVAVGMQTPQGTQVSDKDTNTHFVNLKLGNNQEKPMTINNNLGQVNLSESGETCLLTFILKDTPQELLDNGQLNPRVLLNLHVILSYQSNVFKQPTT